MWAKNFISYLGLLALLNGSAVALGMDGRREQEQLRQKLAQVAQELARADRFYERVEREHAERDQWDLSDMLQHSDKLVAEMQRRGAYQRRRERALARQADLQAQLATLATGDSD